MNISNADKVPKMRTIAKAIAEIKLADPDTDFTEHALRCLVKQNLIDYKKVGSKYLVDLEKVNEYLAG